VLIGDAAAASDPCFGCGLSLTLRDVRVLRDRINEKPDYAEAANVYTAKHDLYYRRLYRIHGWFRELWFGAGAAADALRARALPRIAEDPTRIADFIAFGPEAPSNETADVRRGLVIARWTPDHSPHGTIVPGGSYCKRILRIH